MDDKHRLPLTRTPTGGVRAARDKRVEVANRQPAAGAVALLADMGELSDRLDRAADRSDRRLAAILASAGASVRAARARLGCDLVLVSSGGVARDAQVFEVSGLRIDRESRSVTRAGELLRLSGTMFDMLCLLAEEPTRVFSKADIYRAVWHGEHIPRNALRTVDSYVVRLRTALGGPPLVHTRWGVGVSLLPPDIALAGSGARSAA